LPQLEREVWQRWDDSGDVVGFAISSSIIGREDPDDLRQFVAGMGLTLTVLADYDATLYDEYRFDDPEAFAPYPRDFVVGRDGRIAYLKATLDVDAMNAVIEAELAR
jgi:peroxiredoxin